MDAAGGGAIGIRVVVLLVDRRDIRPARLLHSIVGPLEACIGLSVVVDDTATPRDWKYIPSRRRTLSLTFPTMAAVS